MSVFSATKKQALLEATYSQDKTFRQEALETWSNIVKYLEAMQRGNFQRLEPVRFDAHLGFIIEAPRARLPRDLSVVLIPRAHGAHASFENMGPTEKYIVLGALTAPGDTQNLMRNLEGLKQSFVHEYIHYSDRKRYKNTAHRDRTLVKATQSGDWNQYVRSPAEFNSHFQELASLIEHRLLRLYRDPDFDPASPMLQPLHERNKAALASFQQFLRYVRTIPEAKEMEQAYKNSKWHKKWLKRLEVLYQGLRTEFEKISSNS